MCTASHTVHLPLGALLIWCTMCGCRKGILTFVHGRKWTSEEVQAATSP